MLTNEAIVLPLPDNPLAAKFALLEDAVNAELVEMPRETHAVGLAIASHTNAVLFGEPGTGKTTLNDRIVMRIAGATHYMNQFNSLTGLDDTIGPLDLPTFRNTGAYIRRVKGFMPAANIATMDEGFNAGEALLRALHALVLEHKYSQDGEWVDSPLRTTIILSNDPPEGKPLRAFFDRMTQALWTERISETENFITMLQGDFDEEVEPILTWAEVEETARQVKLVPVPREIDVALASMRRELADQGIEPSDRRWKQGRHLLKTEAFLCGDKEVATDHLPILVNVIPRAEDQVSVVEQVVLRHANPMEREALTLLADVEAVADLVRKGTEAKDKEQRKTIGREAYIKQERAHQAYREMKSRAGTSRRQVSLLAKIKDKAHQNSVDLLTKVFECDADTVAMPNFE